MHDVRCSLIITHQKTLRNQVYQKVLVSPWRTFLTDYKHTQHIARLLPKKDILTYTSVYGSDVHK